MKSIKKMLNEAYLSSDMRRIKSRVRSSYQLRSYLDEIFEEFYGSEEAGIAIYAKDPGRVVDDIAETFGFDMYMVDEALAEEYG